MNDKKLPENLTDIQRTELYQQIWSSLSAGCQSSEKPRFVLLCGMPGSGKSTIAHQLAGQYANGTVTISRDDLFNWYPGILEFNKAHPGRLNNCEFNPYNNTEFVRFVNGAAKYVIHQAQEKKYNVIYDTVIGSSELNKLKEFKNAGHQCAVLYLSAPKRILDTRIISRYFLTCRNFIDSNYIQAPGLRLRRSPKIIQKNYETLNQAAQIAPVTICDYRNYGVLYDSAHKYGQQPGEVMLKDFERALTSDEKLYIQNQSVKMQQQMSKQEINTPFNRNVVSSLQCQYKGSTSR